MKLTQFATAAILVLLAVAGYLTIKSDQEARQADQNAFNEKVLAKMDEISKKQAAPVVSPPPAPPVATVAPVVTPAPPAPVASARNASAPAAALNSNVPMAAADDPRMLEDERKILDVGSSDRTAQESLNLPGALDGKPLSPVQSRIVALPAIAQVKQFSDKDGINFLVLNRGTAANFKPGDEFALRRKTAVIGRIKISDTIDTNECVADLLPNTMPVGMTPAPGDDIIQFDR